MYKNKVQIIKHKTLKIPVVITKNKLSKNYKLTFDKKYMRGFVSIPSYVSFASGLCFAKEHIDWLYIEMKKYLPLIYLSHNTSLMIEGKISTINFQIDSSQSIKVLYNKVIVSSNKKNHKKLLIEWLKQKVTVNAENSIRKLIKFVDIDIKDIKLSNSFNYWGSCNSNGIIHLNWRLVFSPIEVLNYIIAHEICHLIEFNHNRNFWRLVEEICPDYKKQIDWLKYNESYLYRVRVN